MPRQKYSDDDLIRILRDAAELLGRPPTMRDFDEQRVPDMRAPGSFTYKARFKTWSNALRLAFGEHVASARTRGIADDEKLARDLRELAERLGYAPTAAQMTAVPGGHHANTYIRHYGSWRRAVRAILPPDLAERTFFTRRQR